MADLTTRIRHEAAIEALGHKYDFLKNIDVHDHNFTSWHYSSAYKKGYMHRKALNVIFIGQTGYGKSSLLNALLGLHVFETSDYEACTKVLQSSDYFLQLEHMADRTSYVLSFVDLPGIGESDETDNHYLQWYQSYIAEATVVVYLFRADKRDHTQDEFFFNHVFNKTLSRKLLCLLSQADKIEPISRRECLSVEQLKNLESKKKELLSKSFLNFYDSDITHVSTILNINIDATHDRIISKIQNVLDV